MSVAKVFCSWSIAAILLLLSIHFSDTAKSEKSSDPVVEDDGEGEEANKTSNITLTGNPQIDYIHDPNLPFQLNGYNLSDYPFYHRVPKNINFSCDGRKDGFYASVEHKCQIYHHCLFNTRYDFICANYTAFDQRTFICQFVSDVDCPNSHMFFHRNKELYVTKSSTTPAPLVIDRDLYRPRGRRPGNRPRLVSEVSENDQQVQERPQPAEPSDKKGNAGDQDVAPPAPPQVPKRKVPDYVDDDDYYEEDDYPVRRPARPNRRRNRKCRNGRRRRNGRCRPRRPAAYYYDDDDYSNDDYDYSYYDDVRPKKGGKRRRPLNAIPQGSTQVTSTSSVDSAPTSSTTTTTTTTTTTELPPVIVNEQDAGPLDTDSVSALQTRREELLKTRRQSSVKQPTLRPKWSPSPTSSTTPKPKPTTTTTERAKTPTKAASTTEVPQYIYDYEYYEDDGTPGEQMASSSTTSTTPKPSLRNKLRSSSSKSALLDRQRNVSPSEPAPLPDEPNRDNTIRRRDNSSVLTPNRVSTTAAPPPTSTTTSPPSTTTVSRPARFWQRKSTVKSISTTTAPSTSTTTTTLAPYYQDTEYQEYDDMEADPQPTAPPKPIPAPQQPRTSNRFQAIINPPQHQYGTSPTGPQLQSYSNNIPSAAPHIQQQTPASVSSGRGHTGSNSYAPPRPQKHYAMQPPPQYSQSSSSPSISPSSRDPGYNTNSYHRQRSPSPAPVIPKPEFISLVDEDYNNPYMSAPSSVPASSPTSSRFHSGAIGTVGASPGYHQQHPIRFFEQHQSPAFLFGSASEYNNPQFAYPPRSYPSPSNFQQYGHSNRRLGPHHMYKKK